MSQSFTITGATLVGAEDRLGGTEFAARNAVTGGALNPAFRESQPRDVEDACRLAAEGFTDFTDRPPAARASFLELVATEIAALGDALIERAMAETALPRARLEGERGRTLGQLQFFARLVREGRWLDATIDHPMPQRAPLPRPDLRRCNVALGPVAVFGASNFPLAFSVAGGDTAAALAAGCPVIVKGHPLHPGTGELVARALRSAVQKSQLPAGTFSYLPGASHDLGSALVSDPRIRAVAFTGSRGGGLALARLAAARAEPIPVYAEMSSVNPVILFPSAARARGAELAQAFVASLTLGAGQFCTNPGLVLALGDEEPQAFMHAAAELLGASAAQQMLSVGIHAAYVQGTKVLSEHPSVKTIARGSAMPGATAGQPGIFITEAAAFLAEKVLGHEVFGPASLIVRVRNDGELLRVLREIEGQLTATLLFDSADEAAVAGLLPVLQQKVGRILANGWPTGVEVCHAMVHGGPFPATSDVRSTSVGSLAMQRFLRPVCFQNMPEALLPYAVRDSNPYQLPRTLDGVLTLAV